MIRTLSLLLAIPLLAQGSSLEPPSSTPPVEVPQVSMPTQYPTVTISPNMIPAAPASPPVVARLPVLSAEVMQALLGATKGTLYSLEPTEKPQAGDKTFHNYKVLGQTELDPKQLATTKSAFQSAIADGDKNGMSLCMIEPRHALSVTMDGHTYDFLLCYQCSQLEVLKDNQKIAFVNAAGTPDQLNAVLTAAKVPLSQSGLALAAQNAEYQKKAEAARARWVQAMPKSIQPLWDAATADPYSPPDVTPMRAPLAAEFPDVTQRIRMLLNWYGSGSTDWANVPAYENAALTLLHDYSTAEMVAAIQAGPLSDGQLNGAARALSSYRVPDKNAPRTKGMPSAHYDLAAIPAPVKAMLLEYVQKSGNRYNITFANWAFSPPPALAN